MQKQRRQGSTSQRPLEEKNAIEELNGISETRDKAEEGVQVIIEQVNRQVAEEHVGAQEEVEHPKVQVLGKEVEISPLAEPQLGIERAEGDQPHTWRH